MQRRWLVHVAVICAYGLLALALTWPLAAHPGSHVPGNGADDPPLTWNLWWVPTALLDLGRNPFHADYIFYPLGINLAFYTLTVLNGLLSIPLQAVLGLVASSNVLLLSSFVVGAYGTFLLAALVTGAGRRGASLLPAVAAGLIYAFSSNKLYYAALGQWNIASSQWIPFYVLYLVKMGHEPRRLRYPLLAALFLVMQAYAELTYASFLALFTGLWLAWHLLAPGRGARLVLDVGLVALLVVAGCAPLLWAMVPDLLAEGDIWTAGGGFADVFSADLVGFAIPTSLHPLWGDLAARFSFHQGVGQHIYPGYVVVGLALLGAIACWRRPAVRFWVLSTAFFWLLTLGPSLQVNGRDTGLPLPFALVAQLPFFKGNRYPSRYSVLLVLSLAILAAFGLTWLLARVTSRASGRAWHRHPLAASALLLAGCCLLLFEHLSLPLPLSDMAVPPVYERVAALPGDFTLLDLPVAWRNGSRVTGTLDPIIMFEQYYQAAHGKRLLAGNTSRNPLEKFQYYVEAPVISSLVALETGHDLPPEVLEADRALAPWVMRFFDVQAIVVHPAQAGPGVVPYLEETLALEPMYDDGETLAYRVALPPWPEQWTVRPGEALAGLSLAEGWGPAQGSALWAQRRSNRLLLPLAGREARLSLRVYAPGAGQRLRVQAGDWTSPWLPLPEGWSDQEVRLPAGAGPALANVWLHFERLYPTAGTRLAPRLIGGTGVESPANLVVRSAGQEVGSLGQIFVDGRDVSPGGRGYNLAVIHPESGAVEATASFDTHLDAQASSDLAAFLAGVPPGRIVAVAAADEASRLLGGDAVAALQGLGAGGDLRDRFRWGHAFVGVQGAAPGSALEALDWLRPVTVTVGEAATEPDLAAALDRLTVSAEPAP